MKFEESMLSGFLDDELTSEEQVFLKRHLDANPKDRQTLESMAKLRAMLSQLPEESFQTDPVVGVRKRIAEQLAHPGLRDGGGGDLENNGRLADGGHESAAVAFSERRPGGEHKSWQALWLWAGLATAASVLLLGVLVFGPKLESPMVATKASQREISPGAAVGSDLAFKESVVEDAVANNMMVRSMATSSMVMPGEVIQVELPAEKVDLAFGWLAAQGAVQVGVGGLPPEDRLAILESRKAGELDPTAGLDSGAEVMLPDGAIAIQFQIPADQSASFIAALQQWGQASSGGQRLQFPAGVPQLPDETLPATVASDGLIASGAGPGGVAAASGVARIATPASPDAGLLAKAADDPQPAVPAAAPVTSPLMPLRMWVILRPQAKP
jgi:hypothetical protein